MSDCTNTCINLFEVKFKLGFHNSPITKHGNHRKLKYAQNTCVFFRFISYFSIVWNILKDILVFSKQLQLNFYGIDT